jgi:hypothetical protein
MKRITRPRSIAKNQMHNLWKNKNMWWMNYTVENEDGSVTRKRVSTKCKDAAEAIAFRDAMFSNTEHK